MTFFHLLLHLRAADLPHPLYNYFLNYFCLSQILAFRSSFTWIKFQPIPAELAKMCAGCGLVGTICLYKSLLLKQLSLKKSSTKFLTDQIQALLSLVHTANVVFFFCVQPSGLKKNKPDAQFGTDVLTI